MKAIDNISKYIHQIADELMKCEEDDYGVIRNKLHQASNELVALSDSLVALSDSLERHDRVDFTDIWPKSINLNDPCRMQLPVYLGVTYDYKKHIIDLASMSHLLIGGTNAHEKENLLDSIVYGLAQLLPPSDLRFIVYDIDDSNLKLPHLAVKVVTEFLEFIKVIGALLQEMKKRQKEFSLLEEFSLIERSDIASLLSYGHKMPYIVVVIKNIDRLITGHILEDAIDIEHEMIELFEKGSTVGIHFIATTQYEIPAVLSKSFLQHFSCRISFQTINPQESILLVKPSDRSIVRTDVLRDSGEMLVRLKDGAIIHSQSAQFTEMDKARVLCKLISAHPVVEPPTAWDLSDGIPDIVDIPSDVPKQEENPLTDEDVYKQALDVIRVTKRASVSHFQRRMGIGYNHATRIIDMLEERGIIGPPNGIGSREIKVDLEELNEMVK